MTRAEQIWDAFKGELIDNGAKDSEDMRQALATVLRNVANEHQYYQCCRDQDIEDMVVDARVLYDLADELEDL